MPDDICAYNVELLVVFAWQKKLVGRKKYRQMKRKFTQIQLIILYKENKN